tara:strand:+ start:55 stop:1533 length:1479 start_codon:yes stop_codon:yes gene_type:complete
MKMKFYILIIISVFCLQCASQGSPSGGPIDVSGPEVISIEPQNNIIGVREPIEIIFNEYIDQSSVGSSIFINNSQDFETKVRYNKIILYPLTEWDNINELFISRSVRDYQKNSMEAPFTKVFITNDLDIYKGEISGELINFDEDNIYEIALYLEDDSQFIKKIEADIDGFFKFANIADGDYRIGVIEGNLNNFEYDYRKQKYGINSRKIRIKNGEIVKNIKIMISEPLPKLTIVSGNLSNGNHAVLMLSDGTEKSFFVESDRQNKKYINGDSIYLNLNYYNRLESYQLGSYNFVANYMIDTLPPSIKEISLNEDKLNIFFSEPILLLSNKIFVDSKKNHINHTMKDPFTLTAKVNYNDTADIYINRGVISDFDNNKIDSILSISVPYIDDYKKFGSLKGRIDYKGDNDVVVKLVSNITGKEYFTSTNNNIFEFIRIPEGKYYLESYEKKHPLNEVYYSGIWTPFQKSAQIVKYPDLIDIRARWNVEGIEINF